MWEKQTQVFVKRSLNNKKLYPHSSENTERISLDNCGTKNKNTRAIQSENKFFSLTFLIKHRFISGVLLILLGLFSFNSCRINYSMTGASIAPDVKTVSIRFFQKTAGLGPASLGQTFTESLKDKFISQTNLNLVDKDADLTFEGNIPGYTISPLAIQANEVAAQNRLSISVNVKFTNIKDEKQNFETTFSRFADFESTLNIATIEDQLIKEINDQLIDDIFNKAVINW
ncbi:MAG: hypothetical protein EYC69_00080 [Bacteroidetes bacterium]|nr:MAG: hypothetical protein EYC69_00080 [Bacteroidota bacterium]